MAIWVNDLAWITAQMGLLPCRTFCECAVGPIEISVAPGFKGKCKEMLLIEPHPVLAAKASNALGLPIIQVAIGFESGSRILVENNGSSYLFGTWSPSPANPSAVQHPVRVMTFDELDQGTIDVLALDCEGMEWAVLSKMRSLPKLLTIEIWSNNPYRKEIEQWIKDNKYQIRFSTGPTAETHLYSLE